MMSGELFMSRESRKRRRAQENRAALAAELAQLEAEEKWRAKEERVEVAGRKAFLNSFLRMDDY